MGSNPTSGSKNMKNSKSRLPVPQYSYRQSIKKEDREIYRRIALILTAFFVILLILWFTGTNFINALGILSRGGTQNNQKVSRDSDLPLLAPELEKLPESINLETINISGSTTSEVTVKLFINTKEISKTKADTTGNFVFEKVKLIEGLNLIKVVSENSKGEKKETSTTITLDKTKPNLFINSPSDGTIYPANTKTVNVSGTTEPNAVVHVNSFQAVVDQKGSFSLNLPVTPGVNSLDFSSVDAAGNVNNIKLSVSVEGTSEATDVSQ